MSLHEILGSLLFLAPATFALVDALWLNPKGDK